VWAEKSFYGRISVIPRDPWVVPGKFRIEVSLASDHVANGHGPFITGIVGVVNESRMTRDEGARKRVYLRKRDEIKRFVVYLAQKTLPFRRRLSFRTVQQIGNLRARH
jgi:hypothetical protein